MPQLHPFWRTYAAAMLAIAAFATHGLAGMAFVYSIVITGLVTAGIIRKHLKFVVLTVPLLLMLIFVRIFAAPPAATSHTPFAHAVSVWLRLLVCGGVFQWFAVPLLDEPARFRSFLSTLRIPGSIGILLVTPILFLPEVQRRMNQIIDARKAQGIPSTGLAALRGLPAILVPLVSSLLDSGLARAELWAHRGLLDRHHDWGDITYSALSSIPVSLAATAPLALGAIGWI